MSDQPESKITEATRRNIFDALTLDNFDWSGRMTETEFLGRIYDLAKLPSYDHRYKNAFEDITKHCEWNNDWDLEWIYTDARFGLFCGSDEVLLRFLTEMLHPVVQPDSEKLEWLTSLFNRHLALDGWEIFQCGEMSGRPIYAARSRNEGASFSVNQARSVAATLDASYVSQQVTRMESSLKGDPELAIGTAKEFVETVCKTILNERDIQLRGNEDVSQLVRLTLKELKLTPDDVSASSQAAETIRILLGKLASISQSLAELRNLHGSGHGKDAKTSILGVRHARLAVQSATSLAVFIFETHQEGQPGFAESHRDEGKSVAKHPK
ncbi:abortive infection family protein [Singulisphaera sp. Ch08]|uniref:Abortive infection family protein n=1 Tax=Singulisphaera sp. Ch08 TaxID=3120278 RepID=A0AAU7CAD6_9BACT